VAPLAGGRLALRPEVGQVPDPSGPNSVPALALAISSVFHSSSGCPGGTY
jgi:hypothetical protein